MGGGGLRVRVSFFGGGGNLQDIDRVCLPRCTLTHRRCGLYEVQARLLGEVVDLLLVVHLQLLHQLKGLHVGGGSGASAWLFFLLLLLVL